MKNNPSCCHDNPACCKGVSHVERAVRILAGSLIIVGLLLAYTVHPYWIALPAFVGLNLFQSGFTKFCPAEMIFRKLMSGKGSSLN